MPTGHGCQRGCAATYRTHTSGSAGDQTHFPLKGTLARAAAQVCRERSSVLGSGHFGKYEGNYPRVFGGGESEPRFVFTFGVLTLGLTSSS
jgi:hypothetical protein